MEKVFLKGGLSLVAQLIKKYPNGKLFFLQERLLVTNLKNQEIESVDIIDIVEQIF